MKVTVNNQTVDLFRGATVADAVRVCSEASWRRLVAGQLAAFDRFGNLTEADGPLNEGQIIILKEKHEK